MEDHQIVELYWQRSESAIAQTEEKYGRYCYRIAFNLLQDDADAEECVNDTFLKAWEAMPPHRPSRLSTFLGKITRNLALNRYEMASAQKRCPAGGIVSSDAFQPTLADKAGIDPYEHAAFKDAVNRFLRSLPRRSMIIFLRRYWYFSSISDISRDLGITQSSVKVSLHRTREQFREFLKEEGYAYE